MLSKFIVEIVSTENRGTCNPGKPSRRSTLRCKPLSPRGYLADASAASAAAAAAAAAAGLDSTRCPYKKAKNMTVTVGGAPSEDPKELRRSPTFQLDESCRFVCLDV